MDDAVENSQDSRCTETPKHRNLNDSRNADSVGLVRSAQISDSLQTLEPTAKSLSELESKIESQELLLAETTRRVAAEIREKQELLEFILEQTLSGYWDWRIDQGTEYMSPSFKRMLGYEEHEMPNRPETWQGMIFPEDLPGVLENVRRHVDSHGATPCYNEVRYRHKDGSTVWVICSGKLIEWDQHGTPTRMVGCHVDITRQKQTEEKLNLLNLELEKRVKERNTALFESEEFSRLSRREAELSIQRMTRLLNTVESIALIGGWELDAINNSLFWTDEVFRIHEVSPHEYTPTLETALLFYDLKTRELIVQALQRCVEYGEPYELEMEFTTAKGHRRWVLVTVEVTRENGKTTKIVGSFQDISRRKATEEALRKSEQAAAIGQMAARVAHEINNPLAGISSAFQLVKDAVPDTHRYFSYVGRIENEIRRIAKVVRQMLDLYRPENETPAEFVLSNVLSDVVALLESGAKSHGVQINLDKSGDELRLILHENWLRQILFNLVQNAVDASLPNQGIVRIYCEAEADSVRIVVEDNGTGIDPEILPRLFEPFFTTKRDSGRSGVGLGLSVSKNLVEAMGGRIHLKTQLNVGSKFSVILPLKPLIPGMRL